MSKQKVLSLMGFAKKARKLQTGYNTALTLIEKKKAKLLILAEDLSENTKDKLSGYAKRFGVECRIYGSSEELSQITGELGKGVFIVTEKGFADAMIKEMEEMF